MARMIPRKQDVTFIGFGTVFGSVEVELGRYLLNPFMDKKLTSK